MEKHKLCKTCNAVKKLDELKKAIKAYRKEKDEAEKEILPDDTERRRDLESEVS